MKVFLKAKTILRSQQGRTSRRTEVHVSKLCSLIIDNNQCLLCTFEGHRMRALFFSAVCMFLYFTYVLVILYEYIMYIIKHPKKLI